MVSPLVTRDIDILRTCLGVSVGFSIPTDDDRVRKILEPEAPVLADLYNAARILIMSTPCCGLKHGVARSSRTSTK